jgi:hypothetical protein
VFSGLYWLYLVRWRTPRQLVGLAALAAAAPALWLLTDGLVTGDPFWSLTNTRHTARALARVTGIGHVPEFIPRRIGEILRPPVLVGAALGGVLSLWWLRERSRLVAAAGALAVVVFATFATAGLPINTRYAFLVSAILCVFCGAGVFGWTLLARGDPRRRWWMAGAGAVLVALVAFIPAQYDKADHELDNLARQQVIQDDLVGLVTDGAISPSCEPIGVPNHRPIPLLALRLKASPSLVRAQPIDVGTFVAPANRSVLDSYILDPRDPLGARVNQVPSGFKLSARDAYWHVYRRCA